jgi:hypothetical protein
VGAAGVNGTVTTWVEKARPFVVDLTERLSVNLDADTLREKLAKLGKTPEQFLAENAVALLQRSANNAWIIQLCAEELVADAQDRIAGLISQFGSAQEAVLALAREDLGAIVKALRV